jgi:hypothetical protein
MPQFTDSQLHVRGYTPHALRSLFDSHAVPAVIVRICGGDRECVVVIDDRRSKPRPDHTLHFVGEPRCVAEGCEPPVLELSPTELWMEHKGWSE